MLDEDITYISTYCPTFTTLPPANWPYTVSGVKGISIDCYYKVLDNRLNTIESAYSDIELEFREYKDVYFTNDEDSYRIRFLKDMDIINTSFFVQGTRPTTVNEIAVAETFAKNNQLSVGSLFTVNDKEYTISGFVLFPDYNLPMFGSDFILDNATQTVGLLSDDEFENIILTIHSNEWIKALELGLEYFVEQEEYETCAHIRNLLIKIKTKKK